MAFKWSAVQSFESHNTRKEWFDKDGNFRASVQLQVKWEDRFKLVQDLYTSRFGLETPAAPSGYNPRVYPDPGGDSGDIQPPFIAAPVMSKIGVTSATVSSWGECGQPKDASNEVLDYKTSAFVQVQYGAHFNIEDKIEFDVETITQSYLDFRWKTSAFVGDLKYIKELEVPVTNTYSGILTRNFIGLAAILPDTTTVPLVPSFPTLMDTVGDVNSRPFTSRQLGRTFKKGTLLMIEPETRPSVDMQNFVPNNRYGEKGFTVTVKFLYKRGGDLQGEDEDTHNLFWRPGKKKASGLFNGAWDRLLMIEPDGSTRDYKPFDENPAIDDNWLINSSPPLSVDP